MSNLFLNGPRAQAVTRDYALARHRWEDTAEGDRDVGAAFWDAMQAANGTPTFSNQRDVYGVAEQAMAAVLGRLTGLRGKQLETLVETLVERGDFDVAAALAYLWTK